MTSISVSSSQSDTSLWLHNKLGTSNDSWTFGSIASQLSPEILDKIQCCFQDLQPQVKLKLLLSLFHIPRRHLEQWCTPHLDSLLQLALQDSEPWVAMTAEIMKHYPKTGCLNLDIEIPEANRKTFSDVLVESRRALKKSTLNLTAYQLSALSIRNDIVSTGKDIATNIDNSTKQGINDWDNACHAPLHPVESVFLNKNAYLSLVGLPTDSVVHFTLRRKPKAANLKVELLSKSSEMHAKQQIQQQNLAMRRDGNSTNSPASHIRRTATHPSSVVRNHISRCHNTTNNNSNVTHSSGEMTSNRYQSVIDSTNDYTDTGSSIGNNQNSNSTTTCSSTGVKLLDVSDLPQSQMILRKQKRKAELEEMMKERRLNQQITARQKQIQAAQLQQQQQQAAILQQNRKRDGKMEISEDVDSKRSRNMKKELQQPVSTVSSTNITSHISNSMATASTISTLNLPLANSDPNLPMSILSPTLPREPDSSVMLQQQAVLARSLIAPPSVTNSSLAGTIPASVATDLTTEQHQQILLLRQQQTSIGSVSSTVPNDIQTTLSSPSVLSSVFNPRVAIKSNPNMTLPGLVDSKHQLASMFPQQPIPLLAPPANPTAVNAFQRSAIINIPRPISISQASEGKNTDLNHYSQSSTSLNQEQLISQLLPQLKPIVQQQQQAIPLVKETNRLNQDAISSVASANISATSISTAMSSLQPATSQYLSNMTLQQQLRAVDVRSVLSTLRPTQNPIATAANISSPSIPPPHPPLNISSPPTSSAISSSLSGVTLSREQMSDAQEMFRTANKVTRPEKALILGFMAGSRENPCPHLGHVVTIKLSEGQERMVQSTDGSDVVVDVETHFQMNYLTGEWKRIKKYRRRLGDVNNLEPVIKK